MEKLVNIVVFVVLRVLHATYRYRVYGVEHRKTAEARAKCGAVAFATWHGYSLAGTLAHARQRVRPLCSRSRDGGMVAFVCKMMGMNPVRGSSSRGGKEARDEIISSFNDGDSVGITVDGPKGPPKIVKAGIVDVARRGGVAILPLTARGDRNWTLGSWDRLNVPKPFSRIAVCYGEPIFVIPEIEGDAFEAVRVRVQEVLLQHEALCQQKLADWKVTRNHFVTLRSLQNSQN